MRTLSLAGRPAGASHHLALTLALPLALGLAGCPDPTEPVSPTSPIGTETEVPGFPQLSLSPEAIDVGEVVIGQSAAGSAVASNTGSGTLMLSAALSSDTGGAFTFGGPDAEIGLEPGESITLTVTFAPQAAGAAAGALVLSTNDEAAQEVDIPLSGVGVSDDADGDGWVRDEDCDDDDASVHPQAEETCDGEDQDCDDEIDEDATGAQPFYDDDDGDGFGAGEPALSCQAPAGSATDDGDCDDDDPAVHPGADERCGGGDEDCDGEVDEDPSDPLAWFVDADGDGFGQGDGAPLLACAAPSGAVNNFDDCDDTDAAIWPGADERCDDKDGDCDGVVDEGAVDAQTWYSDADGDGAGAGDPLLDCAQPDHTAPTDGDCDDTRAEVAPGLTETCDGLDNDCDAATDEGLTQPLWADLDGDGFGDPGAGIDSCTPTRPGYVIGDGSASADCDDADAATWPGAEERCDGGDDDCDGAVDEEAVDQGTFYPDGDGDGYAAGGDPLTACEPPQGYAAQLGDCDDADPAYNPGAAEADCADPNDYNCDGSTAYDDGDGDGHPACQDCDDQDPAAHPGAEEVCDGDDEDCDGQVDEGVTTTFYADADGDGHGDAASPIQACAAPDGTAPTAGDCDDHSAAVSPAATETCDGRDTDCDGLQDEDGALGCADLYPDADGDTYGSGEGVCSCDPRLGYTTRPGDCDDDAPEISPGALERCNQVDDDCDAETDEEGARGCTRFYDDEDLDGWGDTQDLACLCTPEGTYTSTANGDCNDHDDQSYPGNLETCDGKDNNCNGQIDEGVTTTFYLDGDHDGYGVSFATAQACAAPAGYVAQGGDCNDFNGAISPGAPELCNEVDDNCNGLADEGLTLVTVYIDLDGDEYGAEGTSGRQDCLLDTDGDGVGETAPDGYALTADDCDDSASVVHPGAPELCDGRLNNCDLTVPDIQCPELCEGEWPVFVGGSAGYPIIAQMDGDNQLEVVVQNEGKVRVLGHDGQLQWSRDISVSYSYPNVADFNYDDTLDVVVNAHGGTTHILNGSDGSTLTTVATSAGRGYYGSIAMDVDGDGATDLIPSGNNPYDLVLMNRDRTIKSQIQLNPLSGEFFLLASPALYDFEGDGVAEVLIGSGSWQCGSNIETCKGRLYAYRADGGYYNDPTWTDPSSPWFEVEGYPYTYAGEGRWAVVADADGDGAEDISQHFVDASGATASRSWIWDRDGEVHPDSGSAWNTAWPILAPIKADGRLELSGKLRDAGGPVVDIDGDGTYEVIRGVSGGLAVTRGGQALDGWPIQLSGRSVVGDLNRDGRLDLVFLSGSNNSVNCYTLGEGTYSEARVLSHGTVDGLGRNWYTTGRLDPYEPNDRRAEGFDPPTSTHPEADSRAFHLGPLRDVFASGNGWYRRIKALIAEPDDVDYYVMYGSIIRVQLTTLVKDYDIYLHQYRSDGTYINTMSSTGAGTAAENITCHSTSGCAETGISKILIIEVRGKDPSVDYGPFPYQLSTIWAN